MLLRLLLRSCRHTVLACVVVAVVVEDCIAILYSKVALLLCYVVVALLLCMLLIELSVRKWRAKLFATWFVVQFLR